VEDFRAANKEWSSIGPAIGDFWSVVPDISPVYLPGTSIDELKGLSNPQAVEVVCWTPGSLASPSSAVDEALTVMEEIVVARFPHWLPTAHNISGRSGVNEEVVKALALRLGSELSGCSGPYMAELAVRSIRQSAGYRNRFPVGLRVRTLAQLLAMSSGEDCEVGLVVELTEDLDAVGQSAAAEAARFLAASSPLRVCLVGQPPMAVDWLVHRQLSVAVRSDETAIVTKTAIGSDTYSGPVIGAPHPASEAEQMLERALGCQLWAVGRSWNQTFQTGSLCPPIRFDLAWLDERLVVEIDGPEHREASHYETDRQRDVRLLVEGYVVARFTNDAIFDDVAQVVAQIEQLLNTRRVRS